MAFTEKIKKEVRRKADGRCCICHSPFVDVHHIIPQNENGSNDIDNAAPLCSNCHTILGDNPKLRKQIKEMRDSWYEIVSVKKSPKKIKEHHVHEKIKIIHDAKPTDEKMVALYHVVYEHENFNDAAYAIVDLTRESQKKFKNKRRALYLDIDGHRLKNGAFDNDMWELQYYFIAQNLFYFYTEIHLPLITIYNPYEQIEDVIPDDFIIYDENEMPEELEDLKGTFFTTYISDENKNKQQKNAYVKCD